MEAVVGEVGTVLHRRGADVDDVDVFIREVGEDVVEDASVQPHDGAQGLGEGREVRELRHPGEDDEAAVPQPAAKCAHQRLDLAPPAPGGRESEGVVDAEHDDGAVEFAGSGGESALRGRTESRPVAADDGPPYALPGRLVLPPRDGRGQPLLVGVDPDAHGRRLPDDEEVERPADVVADDPVPGPARLGQSGYAGEGARTLDGEDRPERERGTAGELGDGGAGEASHPRASTPRVADREDHRSDMHTASMPCA